MRLMWRNLDRRLSALEAAHSPRSSRTLTQALDEIKAVLKSHGGRLDVLNTLVRGTASQLQPCEGCKKNPGPATWPTRADQREMSAEELARFFEWMPAGSPTS